MSDNHNKGKRKRQYINSSSNNHSSKWQPKRGGPAVLLTCETARDGKARREGLQILEYYLGETKKENGTTTIDGKATEDTTTTTPADNDSTKKKQDLSLEEELAQLKSQNNSKSKNNQPHKPFAHYDTGCKGTVFIMCIMPNCALIPSIQSSKKTANTTSEDAAVDDTDTKKQKTEDEKETTTPTTDDAPTTATTNPPWDPLDAVRRVMDDIHQESKGTNDSPRPNSNIPGSRFISRMVPVQATCFASIDEIKLTVRSLLDNIVMPRIQKQQQQGKDDDTTKTTTFGIKFKKRNCGNVTRDQVITAIGDQVDEATKQTWTVNLDKPDYRIQVEICKTLCGISILASSQEDAFMSQHNFNVADLRAKAAEARRGPDNSTTKETTTTTAET